VPGALEEVAEALGDSSADMIRDSVKDNLLAVSSVIALAGEIGYETWVRYCEEKTGA